MQAPHTRNHSTGAERVQAAVKLRLAHLAAACVTQQEHLAAVRQQVLAAEAAHQDDLRQATICRTLAVQISDTS